MRGKKFTAKARRAMLIAVTIACGSVSSCGFGLRDIRHNMVAGTAGFVKSYTTDFFYALFPGWDDIFTPGD
jgi:hypothetical protein